MQARVATLLVGCFTCDWLALAFAICGLGSVALADTTNLPFPEAVLPDSDELLAVTIGPGGPDVEFALSEANGRLYRIALDGSTTVAVEFDALNLVNPTGIVALGDKMFLTDGASVLALGRAGELMWRSTHKAENAFLYDIEVAPDGQLLVTDFGNGRLLQVDPETGAFRRFPFDEALPGIARIEIAASAIYFTSWGSDDAYDGGIHMLKGGDAGWELTEIARGFGNPEALAIIDGDIILSSYRGHATSPGPKLFRINAAGVINAIDGVDIGEGASDLVEHAGTLIATLFKDGAVRRIDLKELK